MAEVKSEVRKFIAKGELKEASDIVSAIRVSVNDEAGTAGKLLLTAELALAEDDPVYALKVAKEAWPKAKKLGEAPLQADVLAVMVNGLYMKGIKRASIQVLKDCINAVNGSLSILKAAGDKELEASILHTQSLAHLKIYELGGNSAPEDALTAEGKVLSLYESLKNEKGMAASLTASAKAHNMLFRYGEAVSAASEAIKHWRIAGNAAGMVAALEVMLGAQASLGVKSGLDTVRDELKLLQKGGADDTNQAILLEYAVQVAVDTGKTAEAIELLDESIALSDSKGNKPGKARKLLQVGALYKRCGLQDAALRSAKEALSLFQELDESAKADEAQALIDSAEAGDSDKVVPLSKSKAALKSFMRAVEYRDVSNVRKYGAEFTVFGKDLKEIEIENAFENLFFKDPEAKHFLEEHGWDVNKYKEAETHYVYTKEMFYLGTIAGGMGFGPTFRIVNPTRKGIPNEPTGRVMSVGQHDQYEAWHQVWLMQHGMCDMGMQQFTCMMFPPYTKK